MARVTVEDCIDKVENHFELVILAAQRARKIGVGAPILVERENDKKTVLALREIAGEVLDVETLKEEMVQNHQRYLPQDQEEEVIDLMDGEKEWSEITDAASSAAGMYAAEDAFADVDDSEDDDGQKENPSLSDIAGIQDDDM